MASSPAAVGDGTGWSREKEKAFENAVAMVVPASERKVEEEMWEEVAGQVGGRTAAEVRRHYEVLVEDVGAIEVGKVPIPCYIGEDDDEASSLPQARDKDSRQSHHSGGFFDRRAFEVGGGQGQGTGCSKSEQERRKGIPWTEEEHRLFLLGLEKYGKGDWRSISRNFLVSRTATQVASHFIHLNSMNRDHRRSSIHNITSVNVNSTNKSLVGLYGHPVGHPVTGHMVSTVGCSSFSTCPLNCSSCLSGSTTSNSSVVLYLTPC